MNFESKYDVFFDSGCDEAYSVGQIDLTQWTMMGIELNAVSTQVMKDACPCIGNKSLKWEIKHSYVLPRSDAKMAQSARVVVNGLYGRHALCPCPRGTSHDQFSSELQVCVKNFKAGKCGCPLMGGIIGAHVLPELYQKQK